MRRTNYITGQLDDELVYAEQMDEANDDWIRAARLQKKDTKASRKELDKLHESKMEIITDISAEDDGTVTN